MGSYTVGLDLGQSDFTALAVVERVHTPPGDLTVDVYEHLAGRTGVGRPVTEHHVRHLQRWPQGTPYPEVVEQVGRLMRRPPLATDGLLIIDRTGVGVAVMDMFRAAYRDGRLAGATHPVGVTITGGDHGTDFNVPKADLMGAVQATLQAGTLRIAAGPLVPVLQKELLQFRQKISVAGRTTYDTPRREGEGHGGLVMALALALVWPNSLRKPYLIDRE